jgi:hypothetical protein
VITDPSGEVVATDHLEGALGLEKKVAVVETCPVPGVGVRAEAD